MEGRFLFFQQQLPQKSITKPYLTQIIKIRLVRVSNLLANYLKQWEKKIFTKEEIEEEQAIIKTRETVEQHFEFCKETLGILNELSNHPYQESLKAHLSRFLNLQGIFDRYVTLSYLSQGGRNKIQHYIPEGPFLASELYEALSHLNEWLQRNVNYIVAKDPKKEIINCVDNESWKDLEWAQLINEPNIEIIISQTHKQTFIEKMTKGISALVNSIFYKNPHNHLIDDREIELSCLSDRRLI